MAIPHARRAAAAALGLVKVSPGYFTADDAAMIEAARDRANLLIAAHAPEKTKPPAAVEKALRGK